MALPGPGADRPIGAVGEFEEPRRAEEEDMRRGSGPRSDLPAWSAFLGVLTLVGGLDRGVSGWDPDKHNGSAQWLVVVAPRLRSSSAGSRAGRVVRVR